MTLPFRVSHGVYLCQSSTVWHGHSWKSIVEPFSESLLSRPYGHTVWGNDLADGSQKPLSASMASTLSFVLPSDGISNIPCLVSCPRACNTRWFGLPSQKTNKIDPKTSEKSSWTVTTPASVFSLPLYGSAVFGDLVLQRSLLW